MSPSVRSILEHLDQLRQRWWLFSLFCRVVLVFTISLALLVAFVVIDGLLRLPQGGLLVLFCAWFGASVVLLGRIVVRTFRRQRTLAAAARRVELSFPQLGSHLINLVQLVETDGDLPESFRLAAIEDAALRVRGISMEKAPSQHTRRQRWMLGLQTLRDLLEACGVLLILVALTMALSAVVPTWSSSVRRLFTPWQYVPQVGAVHILEVTPGNTTVLVGTRLDIVARVASPDSIVSRGQLELWTADGKSVRALLSNTQHDRYSGTIPAVMEPLRYRLQVGDSESEIFAVDVESKPVVREVEAAFAYPDYLNLAPHQVSQPQGDLEAPQYTRVTLKIRSSATLSKGHLHIDDRDIPGRVIEDDKTLEVELLLTHSTSYTIHLFNQHGHTDSDPRVNGIHVIEDAPPTVQLVKPASDTTAVPNGKFSVAARATDDYGLVSVWLEWQLATQGDSSADIHQAHAWPQSPPVAAATVHHELVVPFKDRAPGIVVLVRAVAEDGRRVELGTASLRPQQTASPWRRIEVVDRETKLADEMERLDSLQAELWAILQLQVAARVQTAQVPHQQELVAATSEASAVRKVQVTIRERSITLAQRINVTEDGSLATLKQGLGALANGLMADAVSQAEVVTRAAHVDLLESPVEVLTATQDQIIDNLRKLLQYTRRVNAEALDQMGKRPGGDLPPDVQDKLQKLHDKMEEMLKQQKKVIEATKNLAKKPVEDFTEADEQLLKELAEIEDDWARFMEETHSDFSKLPDQDFANPSMLEEMVEVQTELKMAAGALTKKTADIAVPLEQLGAEMAEEMTTNLEKWLPDTPDRERWSQEESLGDDMKEAPMAELPGELEDIVGELMEEEEDLMDEMEDVSSSAADSLDKGAGWDAMDGPISNMSARGVTGNRLPNSSEIGGRSGEGRQGKSSGEFVSDIAVGKGGRKTPSRLAPDPFTQGQVKDISKDPVGGATGGGKESGAGGEGLEGPVPRQVDRDMKRLAERQAELRNKAEAVDLKFKVLNYHHTDLGKLIDTMATIERDLRSGRYRSALRHRKVLLDGLGQIKSYVEGEFEVRRDQSTNLPANIQKEILSSMEDPSPVGWEEMNRRYFQRLATEDAPPGQQKAVSSPAAKEDGAK